MQLLSTNNFKELASKPTMLLLVLCGGNTREGGGEDYVSNVIVREEVYLLRLTSLDEFRVNALIIVSACQMIVDPNI